VEGAGATKRESMIKEKKKKRGPKTQNHEVRLQTHTEVTKTGEP